MKRRTPLLAVLALCLTMLCSGWMTGSAIAAENRGLAAPVSLLPAELKHVALQDRFIPAATQEAGALQTVLGHVVVVRGDLSQGYYAANGDRVFEQDIVFTLKDGKCRIKLANEDIVTLGDNARLALKEAAGDRGTSEKRSVLSLARGKAMFYAIRLFNHRKAEMIVESPTAVTGVRGTKFGIDLTLPDESARAARPTRLADASPDWERHPILAQGPSPPPLATTVVHGFEGTVEVTSTVDGLSRTVGPGQTVSATPQGMGDLVPTPPEVARSFQAATNVAPPEGSDDSRGERGGRAPGETTDDRYRDRARSDDHDASEVIHAQIEQAAIQRDPVQDPRTNATGLHVGYFAGILSKIDGQVRTLEEVFVSRNRYDSGGNIWARGLGHPEIDFLRIDGGGLFGNPVLKWAGIDGGSHSSGPLERAVAHQQLGTFNAQGEFMEWGLMTIPSFTAGSDSYIVDNRAYWIFGRTPDAGLSLSGNYSGDVTGNFWTAGGGVELSGSFSCVVNLSGGSGAVSGFNLNAIGADNVSASITGASGQIGSDYHFSLGGGRWNLNGVTPAQTSGAGSLYGPAATGIGGVWGMSTDSTGAAGIFHSAP